MYQPHQYKMYSDVDYWNKDSLGLKYKLDAQLNKVETIFVFAMTTQQNNVRGPCGPRNYSSFTFLFYHFLIALLYQIPICWRPASSFSDASIWAGVRGGPNGRFRAHLERRERDSFWCLAVVLVMARVLFWSRISTMARTGAFGRIWDGENRTGGEEPVTLILNRKRVVVQRVDFAYSARSRRLNMLPTAATALSAAQFACVFEKIVEFLMNQIWGHKSDQPNHLPQTPSPTGGLTHREPWPSGLTGNKADTLDVLHFVAYAI